MNKNKKTYWFILGNFPLISAAEIQAVLSLTEPVDSPRDNIWEITTDKLEPRELIARLGGTVKIGEKIGENLSEEKMIELATRKLEGITGKINFGFSLHGATDARPIKNWAKKIKQNLREKNKNARFIFKNSLTLSSVTVAKNKLTERGVEFLLRQDPGGWAIAETRAVQPFEEFGARDFGRPNRDDRSGMLPPKLALMMINLAAGDKNEIFLDPFCGSGTILSEALNLEYQKIYGGDISARAIQDSKKNLDWLTARLKTTPPKTELFHSAITDLTQHLKKESVSTIVTEPYLGRPLRGKENKEVLTQQVAELKKMYLSAFAIFAKILKKNGKIIFIIPRFRHRQTWINIDCQKEIEQLGFATAPLWSTPKQKFFYLLYHRSNQHLGREIWKFTKK